MKTLGPDRDSARSQGTPSAEELPPKGSSSKSIMRDSGATPIRRGDLGAVQPAPRSPTDRQLPLWRVRTNAPPPRVNPRGDKRAVWSHLSSPRRAHTESFQKNSSSAGRNLFSRPFPCIPTEPWGAISHLPWTFQFQVLYCSLLFSVGGCLCRRLSGMD